jgi:ABC-type siderophore export system fused ATPase/permease subunit
MRSRKEKETFAIMLKQFRIIAWIAVILTTVLGMQLYLIVAAAWARLDFWGQTAFFFTILFLVMAIGYASSGPSRGFLKSQFIGG